MPRAIPCFSGGYQRLVNATPTEKLARAMPIRKPKIRSCAYVCTKPMAMAGTMAQAMTMEKIARPPKRSVRMPSGMRPTLPSSTGNARAMLTCTGSRCVGRLPTAGTQLRSQLCDG